MEKFEISVIIPSYNTGLYLQEAVSSVLNQEGDFSLADVIIVDDRSDDEITKEVYDHLSSNKKVRIVENNGPRGPAAARNTGLTLAKGNWIAFLDGDDIYTEGSLQARCQIVDTFPGCKLAGGDFVFWREDGSLEEVNFFRGRSRTNEILKDAFALDQPILLKRPVAEFINANIVHTGTVFVHMDLFKNIGFFDTSLFHAEDYQMWIRLSAISDYAFTPKALMLYRQHDANITKQDIPPGSWLIPAFEQLIDKYGLIEYRPIITQRLSVFHWQNAIYHRKKKNGIEAFKSSIHSLKLNPKNQDAWKSLLSASLGR